MKKVKKFTPHNPYKKEAEEKYGKDAVKRSQEIVSGWGKEKFDAIKQEGGQISENLAKLIGKPVDSEEVQAAVDSHFRHIIQFYDPTWPLLKIYRGLAETYIGDPRFAAHYNAYHPELAQFLHDAMIVYCDKNDSK